MVEILGDTWQMRMRQRAKLAFYGFARSIGMFAASRFLMRRRLLILGYHGFQYTDEASFRPTLFMDPARFAKRLEMLKRGGYSVLALQEALDRCRDGSLPARSVAITIDDGFFSVFDVAAPMLLRHRFPATLYVTSYYVIKGTPVFRLAIQYLFWKSERARFEPLERPWCSSKPVDLNDTEAADEAMWRIIDYGEASCNEEERQVLCEDVAGQLGVDFDSLRDRRAFSLLAPSELRGLETHGIDVQLHTHRHTFAPQDPEQSRRELRDNREALEAILGRRLRHFCYPSGVWDRSILPMLSEEGISSATTCRAGMNDRTTDPLALYRVLDQDDMHEIEFEAELSGFCELIRIVTLRRFRTDRVHRRRN